MANPIDISGLADLDRALSQFPDKVAKRTIAAGLRAGARIIIKSARANLPSNYVGLRKSIKTKILRPKSKFIRIASISPAAPEGWYADIVEFGTLGSRTRPLSPKTRRKRNYNPIPTGLKPIPFMRNAMQGHEAQIVQEIANKLRVKIDREAAKIKK